MTSRCWVPLSMTRLVVSDWCVSAEEQSAQRLEDDDVLLGGREASGWWRRTEASLDVVGCSLCY